jgi:F0F1-type ATP synthase assembly protein I
LEVFLVGVVLDLFGSGGLVGVVLDLFGGGLAGGAPWDIMEFPLLGVLGGNGSLSTLGDVLEVVWGLL